MLLFANPEAGTVLTYQPVEYLPTKSSEWEKTRTQSFSPIGVPQMNDG